MPLSVCPVCNAGVLWPNGWMDQDATWHGDRPRPSHIVLDGNPAPPMGTAPPFLAYACCGQKTGWIKTLLDREVGLGPGNTVLDGDPAPSFQPMSIVAKRLYG